MKGDVHISVPWGPPPEPANIFPTWWRTLLNQSNGVNRFDFALSPQLVWVRLRLISFSPGGGIGTIAIEAYLDPQGKVTGKQAQDRPGDPLPGADNLRRRTSPPPLEVGPRRTETPRQRRGRRPETASRRCCRPQRRCQPPQPGR